MAGREDRHVDFMLVAMVGIFPNITMHSNFFPVAHTLNTLNGIASAFRYRLQSSKFHNRLAGQRLQLPRPYSYCSKPHQECVSDRRRRYQCSVSRILWLRSRRRYRCYPQTSCCPPWFHSAHRHMWFTFSGSIAMYVLIGDRTD